MENEILLARQLLKGSGVSVLDAARFIKNILDFKPKKSSQPPAQFVFSFIEKGKANLNLTEMSFKKGFQIYLDSKSYLRPDSLRDIRYFGNRILKSSRKFSNANFSDLSISDCIDVLESFISPSKRSTNEILPKAKDPKGENKPQGALRYAEGIPERARATSQTVCEANASQFNKARAFLHALFEFAFRRQWCNKNPIKFIEKRKVVEKEILPLSLSQIKLLLENAKRFDCLVPVSLLIYAGIRPRELQRLSWSDIDLVDSSITIRSICSKTGGTRQIEICSALKSCLKKYLLLSGKICPKNWRNKWKKIRELSGFKRSWVQDVLRHTYASFYAKFFKGFAKLQLNMGHSCQYLLRSRYVNMKGISNPDAFAFFS